MNPTNAAYVAHWFVRNNLDTPRNTFNGNMKLQKLLYFSQLVHLAKYGEPLFKDNIYAFKQGSVIESVRVAYNYHHEKFISTAINSVELLDEAKLETVQMVDKIFGKLTATELSDLNHQHKTWQESYNNSILNGYAWKDRAIMDVNKLMEWDIEKVSIIIEAYEADSDHEAVYELNGRQFFYNPEEINVDSTLVNMLESFNGQELAYTLYRDESRGIIIY